MKLKPRRVAFPLLAGLLLALFVLRPRAYLDCARPVRLGDDYGGWVLCRPLRSIRGDLVYTIGVGRNIRWDEAMIAKYGTVHHGWDPTPTAIDYFSKRRVPNSFVFHQIGLGVEDGNLTLKLPTGNQDSYTVMGYHQEAQPGTVTDVPVLSVPSMMKKLGHEKLAILKVDIEGAEFDVIDKWVKTAYRVPADQVLMEFHERYFKQGKTLVDVAIKSMQSLGFEMVVRTRLECTFARKEAIAYNVQTES